MAFWIQRKVIKMMTSGPLAEAGSITLTRRSSDGRGLCGHGAAHSTSFTEYPSFRFSDKSRKCHFIANMGN
ncbi:hypothetical protein [Nonomuraea guangzhouensis]|uniref:DUF397 domain-containing protein n=1 Tax=Nonomuraea guangzhouensis TaxID=1291555 RepID=A0ABW4GDF5_9ACTN|nr:hypothetical protein [Nonomuraea guangzhouensis]